MRGTETACVGPVGTVRKGHMAIYGSAVYGSAIYESASQSVPGLSENVGGGFMNIEKYFEILFARSSISNGELKNFAEDHRAKLNSHNNSGPLSGQFADLLAALNPLYDSFVGRISTEDSASAGQQGETISKNEALASFCHLVSLREARVRDKFPKGSAPYEEFFPHGLSEYNRPTMAKAVVLMDRMVDKATKFVADTGADMVTEFTAARSAFQNARTEQVEQKGEVSEAASLRRAARAALELQLQKNLLTIALMFVGQPERAKDFFDQSKLKNPVHTPPAPPPAPTP